MTLIAVVLPTLLLLGGCAGRYSVGYESTDPEPPFHSDGIGRRLHIPPGQLPPPGLCRIWEPGLPPGHQSPPGDCGRLVSMVPPGAWLLSRTLDDPGHVEVAIHDPHRRGVVVEVEVYVAATGEFVGRRPLAASASFR